ncbi:MAG: polyprenyl synthetase family protein [Planctomycetes bacterium]|nr:polyprenyl synthetase family protein [Planctomycetota bacterium]
MADIANWLASAQAWIEAELERALSRSLATAPPRLAEAVRYPLLGGGKRLRPALALTCCELVLEKAGSPTTRARELALPAALGLEALHTYSLVHDDLPCMDDDDLRRGRPTVHKAYGEATAVLVGDALQALAFEWVAHGPRAAEAVRVLARAAGARGMVGGQALDLASSEPGAAVDLAAVRAIHGLKTAALIEAACELGALAAGARERERRVARAYGRALGLCFQAVDDCLDVTGDAATLGKTPGKDQRLERGTLVAVAGLEGARVEAALRAAEALGALEGWDGGAARSLREVVAFVLQRSR